MKKITPEEAAERIKNLWKSTENGQVTLHFAAGKLKKVEIYEYFGVDSAGSVKELDLQALGVHNSCDT